LRTLVRKGAGADETIDRLFVSALIEARSCERFSVLAEAASECDEELAGFYRALFASELGHYRVFLKLAHQLAPRAAADARWHGMLEHESQVLARQEQGFRIHSGFAAMES
jgi:tRNA-(ms[2]io[6]A)-hydroxylase